MVPGRGHIAVPSGTTVFLESNNMTVVLTFPAGGWALPNSTQIIPNAFTLYIATSAADELRVLNIMDLNGNAMEPTTVDVPGTTEVAAKLLPSAYAINSRRIMMRFEATGALPLNAASQDFIVRAGSMNIPFTGMTHNNINSSLRELYIDFDTFDLNQDGTYGSTNQPVTIAMVPPSQVSFTKTPLGTPLEIQGGAVVQVTDNIKPGFLEAFRGNMAAGPSGALTGVTYPALTRDQVLVVFNELVQVQSGTGSWPVSSMFDVTRENQPSNPISPSMYTVEALNNQGTAANAAGAVDVRMIVVTLSSPINDGLNVAVRAHSLWDGNKDVSGFNVMNNAFETGFLGAN